MPSSAPSYCVHAGGTLRGIVRRLEHIRQLGADAIYLTPIFRAPSNHKYDVASYDEVDPRFGGDVAFDELVTECRKHGLGLILDGVFNHLGREHAWFRKALADAESPEARYFLWLDHPNEYECWQSHRTLPELNLEHPDVQEALITADTSVVRRWLRRGATGWRLDCANDLGPAMCRLITKTAEEEKACDGTIGEIMAYAEDFAQGNCLSGVMNYYFRSTVLALLSGEIDAAQAAINLKRMVKSYDQKVLLCSWNILASHDTPRLATLFPNREQRKLAFCLAFAFCGVPMVYYGEEIGLRGERDPDNRRPMIWDKTQWDEELLAFITQLARLRAQSRALRVGTYVSLPQPAFQTVLAFARVAEHPADTIIIFANASDQEVQGRFFTPITHLFDSLPLRDALQSNRTTNMEGGSLRLTLGPWDVAMLQPEDSRQPRYSFFSGYASITGKST
jgi:alpha-glucosidase